MRFDLHVHTTLSSCSILPLADILRHARSRGLDGVCITDHDTMDARHSVREGIQDDGLCVLFGMEYATLAGDFLLFGPFEGLPTGLPAPQLLGVVEQAGGVAIAAHPFRSARPAEPYVVREGLCKAVEVINGRNSELENLRVSTWRRRHKLTECGGSDAHTLEELGRVTTCFNVPVRCRQELILALQNSQCRAEWNPAVCPPGRQSG